VFQVIILLAPYTQCRIVSFHAPSFEQPKFVQTPIFSNQHLFPVLASEPAPVHEEQNEPPQPDSRARARANSNPLMNQAPRPFNPFQVQPSRRPALPSGVVQLMNQLIPNAPPRVVNPPPSEALEVRDIQPLSIDPMTGEPLKQVSPKFRELLSPTAPPVSVPNPINIDNFGRGFGGAPILDVEGQAQADLRVPNTNNNAASILSSFGNDGSSFQSFSFSDGAGIGSSNAFGPSTPSPRFLETDSGISSFQPSTSNLGSSQSFGSQSSFQPLASATNGFGPLGSAASTGGDESSVSTVTTSQVLPGTTSSFSSTVYH
jgi:hypothetical protein